MDKIEKLTANIGDMALKRRLITSLKYMNILLNDRVLDCGCGEGLYLMIMSKLYNCELHGFDKDKRALEIAKRNAPHVYIKEGDIYKLPYEDEYFDKILCSEVLEHIPDDKRAIKEIYRVLKKGGKLVVTVPNYNYPFLWDPINKILETLFKTHIKSGVCAGIWNMHLRLYNLDEISNLIESANFIIHDKKAITHYCIPFNHIILYILKNLLNTGILPESISNSADKYKYTESKQSRLVKFGYSCLNAIDKLNDDLSIEKSSVCILISATK